MVFVSVQKFRISYFWLASRRSWFSLFAFEADLRHVGLLESIVNRSEIGNWKFEIKLSLTAVVDLWRSGFGVVFVLGSDTTL